MKQSISKALLILFFIFFNVSCEKNETNSTLSFDIVSGCVQKGPYLNGTSITISELSKELIPTGKNFASQILDNKGTFEIRNIELSSQYVELKAEGFYFNEINNESSIVQLTLYALSDLTDRSTLNVNIVSSLEKSRVEYLISNGITFINAKKQAQQEILRIFKYEIENMNDSENLDISQTGEDNAILLAISVILQGYLSVAELSELLANISTDIREDGEMNSQTLGETLINNANLLKLTEIRNNLENRYEILGLDVTIPDFEKFVAQFIDSTEFEFTGNIEYPEYGLHGTNLLDRNKTDYLKGDHSLSAILPVGTTLKVKIKGYNWFYPVSQDWSGWDKTEWDDADTSRTFTSKTTGQIDLNILLENDTTYSITKIYVYENGVIEPTWTKEINVY